MTKLPKFFLTVSLAGFAAGSIVDFGGFSVHPAWTIVLPLGAVFFSLFLISLMMEKEMAKFDAEQAERFESARRNEADESKCKNCGNCKRQSISRSVHAAA